MRSSDYTNYGLAQELRRQPNHNPQIVEEVVRRLMEAPYESALATPAAPADALTPNEILSMTHALIKQREADALDAKRWRTFVGLPHEIRAEWASNLSLVPILTEWIDQASKEAAQAAQKGGAA